MTAQTLWNGAVLDWLAFLLTYLLHSTLLLGGVWLALRWRVVRSAAVEDALWKVGLVGGLLTATLQVGLGWSPVSGGLDLSPNAAATPPMVRTLWPEASPPRSVPGLALLAPERTWRLRRPARSHGSASAWMGPAPVGSTATIPRAPQDATGPARVAALAGPVGLVLPEGEPRAIPRPTAAWAALGWPRLAVGLWALLTGIGLARCVALRRRLRRALGRRLRLADPALVGCLDRLRQRAGVRREIHLTTSPFLLGPVALGRSEICLPRRALTDLAPERQEAMVAHELAHLVRRDPAWLALFHLLEAVFFFQPLQRMGRRRFEASAEFLCDDWAVSSTGRRTAFAECLAQVAGWIQEAGMAAPAPGMVRHDSSLVRRVRRLVQGGADRERGPATLAALSLAVLTVVSCGVPSVRAGTGEGFLTRLVAAVQLALAQDAPAPAEPVAPAEPTQDAVEPAAPAQEAAAPEAVPQDAPEPASDASADAEDVVLYFEDDVSVTMENGRLTRLGLGGLQFGVELGSDNTLLLVGEGMELRARRLDLRQHNGTLRLALSLAGDDARRAARAGLVSRLHPARPRPRPERRGDRFFGEDVAQLEERVAREQEEIEQRMNQAQRAYAEAVSRLQRDHARATEQSRREHERARQQRVREGRRHLDRAQRGFEQAHQELERERGQLGAQAERERERAERELRDDPQALADWVEALEEERWAGEEDLLARLQVMEEVFAQDAEEWQEELEGWAADWEDHFEDGMEEIEDEFVDSMEWAEEELEARLVELEFALDELESWFDRAGAAFERGRGRDCDHDCEWECAFGCTHRGRRSPARAGFDCAEPHEHAWPGPLAPEPPCPPEPAEDDGFVRANPARGRLVAR